MLTSAGLADSDNAGRNMRDTDGGISLLNVLTAGAGGAERVNTQIGGLTSTSKDRRLRERRTQKTKEV